MLHYNHCAPLVHGANDPRIMEDGSFAYCPTTDPDVAVVQGVRDHLAAMRAKFDGTRCPRGLVVEELAEMPAM